MVVEDQARSGSGGTTPGGGELAAVKKELAAVKKELAKRDAKIAALEKETKTLKKKGGKKTRPGSAGATAKHDDAGLKAAAGELVQGYNAQLDAAFNVLGKDEMQLVDIDVSLTASKISLEKATEGNKQFVQRRIDADETRRAAVVEKVGQTKAAIEVLRLHISKAVIPDAIKGAAMYNSCFGNALAAEGGQASADAIKEVLDAVPLPKPEPGKKASQQPADGKSLPELQTLGMVETELLWQTLITPIFEEMGLPLETAGGMCKVKKDAARALVKSFRWSAEGDPTQVSDYGRATALFKSLRLIRTFLLKLLAALEAKGYTIVVIKSSLHPSISAEKAGGFRNILLNIKCPKSFHVVELQINLEELEAIKHGPFGHFVYELLRKAGFSDRTEYVGTFTDGMAEAIESGRALSLDFSETVWSADGADATAAATLSSALASPTCRVGTIIAQDISGDGKMEALNAMMVAGASTVTSLDVGGNRLDAEAGKALAKVLETNASLQSLNLYGNGLDAETKAAIKTAWGNRDAGKLSL